MVQKEEAVGTNLRVLGGVPAQHRSVGGEKLPTATGLSRHRLSVSPLRFLLYTKKATKRPRRRKQRTTAAATVTGMRDVSVETEQEEGDGHGAAQTPLWARQGCGTNPQELCPARLHSPYRDTSVPPPCRNTSSPPTDLLNFTQ